MNRPLAFVLALFLAFLTVSSACMAEPTDWIRFQLESERGNPSKIHANFRNNDNGNAHNNWSTGFMPSDLIGLEASSFHGAGSRPVHFALVREAGRLDCAGNGGGSFASGNCRFAENPAFAQLLVRRGIGRATQEQAFAMMAVDVRGELIEALAAAHYPTPSIDNLTALSALGVDQRYIADLSRANYRPQSIQKLVEFKALGITPGWIAGFSRIGYADVPGDGLVEMRAMGITPDFIAGYQGIGYRNLPVETLVQLKALDITPAFVRSVVTANRGMPPVNELVQMKLFGRKR